MNPLRSKIQSFDFAWWEMVLMRAFFAWVMLKAFPGRMDFGGQPYPVGLARYFDLTFLSNPGIFGWLHWIFVAGLVFYVGGRGLALALPVLTLLLSLVGALRNSQGATEHSFQIIALVALAQSLWYCRALRFGLPLALAVLWPMRAAPSAPLKACAAAACIGLGWWLWRIAESKWLPAPVRRTSLENHRIGTFFALQAVVAVYVTCGLSKVITSGFIGWIANARNFPLQLIKNERSDYYNTLAAAAVETTGGITEFFHVLPRLAEEAMRATPAVGAVLLGAALLLELGTWTALLSRGWAALVGLLLIMFHLSVSQLMKLNFEENMRVLLIFFVNPPYWIVRFAKIVRRAPDAAPAPADASPARGRLHAAFRFAPAAGLTLLLLALRENYPFSHFPMYSSLASYTYYIYISGSDGNPLPIVSLAGVRTDFLKKIYNRELEKVREELKKSGRNSRATIRQLTADQRHPAAETTLDWLLKNCSEPGRQQIEPLRPLRITQVELFLDQGRVRENQFAFDERQRQPP